MIARSLYNSSIALVKRIRDVFLPVELYRIKECSSGESIRFVFLGWDYKLRNYWLHRICRESNPRKKRKWILAGRVKQYLNKNREKIDLALIQSPGLTTEKLSYPHLYLLPRWMEMILPTDFSQNRIRRKEVRRRIRKHAMEFDFRNTKEDFDLFYYRMYQPLLKERHTGSAEFATYLMLEKKLDLGAVLLFVSCEGQPKAAQFIEKGDDLPRILTFGVVDGSEEIVKMGVHGALYYFVIEHFGNEGYSSIRCGSSMPVALDGVTQFKMRMGASPFLKDLKERSKYILIPFGSGKGLKEVLKKNPLFHLSSNRLRTIWFVEPDDFHTKEEFLNFYRRIRSDRMERIEICHFGDPGKIQHWVEEERIESIDLIAYEGKTG